MMLDDTLSAHLIETERDRETERGRERERERPVHLYVFNRRVNTVYVHKLKKVALY